MDPTIVVIGFVVLLAALLYVMYKDFNKEQTLTEPEIEKKEPTVIKVRDYEAQLEAEKEAEKPEPPPEPVAVAEPEKSEPDSSDAQLLGAAEEGLENLSGLGEKYRALLKAAGVETRSALAEWDAVDLFKKLLEINEDKQIVRRPPPLATVEDWVKRAGETPN